MGGIMKHAITAMIASILVLITLASVAYATVEVVYNYDVSNYFLLKQNLMDFAERQNFQFCLFHKFSTPNFS